MLSIVKYVRDIMRTVRRSPSCCRPQKIGWTKQGYAREDSLVHKPHKCFPKQQTEVSVIS